MPEMDKLPPMTAPQSSATTTQGTTIIPQQVTPQSYQEMYKILSPYKPKTPEEIDRMKKAEKNAS